MTSQKKTIDGDLMREYEATWLNGIFGPSQTDLPSEYSVDPVTKELFPDMDFSINSPGWGIEYTMKRLENLAKKRDTTGGKVAHLVSEINSHLDNPIESIPTRYASNVRQRVKYFEERAYRK